MAKGSYYVYIMTNKPNGTLYVGVTNDIERRVWEHRNGLGSKFVKRYGLHRLVCVEETNGAVAAIEREKQLKAGSRAKKVALIESLNPGWAELLPR
ncbi:MAG: GIY-YIG nuclease family protein [Gammaproteobacteria bacterium]|nr:GIY-YIG nuclease family protein [Gammaproteobacteria bacterium]